MFSLILGLLTGLAGPISNIATSIFDLKKAKLAADTDVQKAQINAQIQELHDKRADLIAEAGTRVGSFVNGSLRLLLALGPAAYLLKIFLYDKVIGSLYGCAHTTSDACATFNTDPLVDPNYWWVVTAIVGFYFLTTANWRK